MNVFWLILVLILFVIWRSVKADRDKRRELMEGYQKSYGERPDKELTDVRRHRLEGFLNCFASGGEELLDRATWEDLDMDRIFRRMDSCKSGAGEEVLYAQLHRIRSDGETLKRLDQLAGNAHIFEDSRLRAQMALAELGFTGKYSVTDYLDHLTKGEKTGILIHVMPDLLYIPAIILCFFHLNLGAFALMFLISFQVIVYFRERSKMENSLTGFSYLLRLDRCAVKLLSEETLLAKTPDLLTDLKDAENALTELRKGGDYVIFSGRNGAGSVMGSSGIVESLVSLLNMLFHADLILFHVIRNRISGKAEQVFRLICLVGTVDAAISLASFRESLGGNWCRPEFRNERSLSLTEGYHPLLEKPVPADISAGEKGILLTGSNASGKSTFLRMVGINAVLAQTVYTCTAKSYTAPKYQIYSSIAISDNLKDGESYFMAEIRSLKRILEGGKDPEIPVLCFVDEVLRGTNTLERISAGCEILRSFTKNGILCFAATHDLELTGLLQAEYENFHFEETFEGEDVHFSYQLQPGAGASRNAIRLMARTGFEPELIEKAKALAADLGKTDISPLG
jgi:hypothetical protein